MTTLNGTSRIAKRDILVALDKAIAAKRKDHTVELDEIVFTDDLGTGRIKTDSEFHMIETRERLRKINIKHTFRPTRAKSRALTKRGKVNAEKSFLKLDRDQLFAETEADGGWIVSGAYVIRREFIEADALKAKALSEEQSEKLTGYINGQSETDLMAALLEWRDVEKDFTAGADNDAALMLNVAGKDLRAILYTDYANKDDGLLRHVHLLASKHAATMLLTGATGITVSDRLDGTDWNSLAVVRYFKGDRIVAMTTVNAQGYQIQD